MKNSFILYFKNVFSKAPKAFILFLMLLLIREITINFRAKKITLPEADNVCYVVCLGDSFTYGGGAGFENSYPAQLEEVLNQSQDKRTFKVLNFGAISGVTPTSSSMLREFRDKAEPEVIIVLGAMRLCFTGRWEKLEIPLSLRLRINRIKKMFQPPKNKESKTAQIVTIIVQRINEKLTDKKIGSTASEQREVLRLILAGNLSRSNSDFEKAILLYKRAIDIKPRNMLTLLELLRCCKLAEEYDAAIDLITVGIKIDPFNVELFGELDDLLRLQKRLKKMHNITFKLLKLYPNNHMVKKRFARVLIFLGKTFLAEENSKDAIDYFNRAFKLDSDYKQKYSQVYRDALTQEKERFKADLSLNLIRKNNLVTSNNMRAKDRLASEMFCNALEEAVQGCKDAGILLIFVSYPREVSEIARGVAEKNNIPFIDLSVVFKDLTVRFPEKRYFYEKDDHCNRAGYRVIAELISEVILKNLNRD